MGKSKQEPETMRAIGYVRVATEEQAGSGAGLSAQRRAIENACEGRGWTLERIYEDHASGKSMNGRAGLGAALKTMEQHEADVLVVSKLDRLSRSLMDFSGLMERSRREGWALVALDLGVDTSTPSGEMMANVLAVFAQFERRMIGQRTKDALAVKRAEGIRLGRPAVLSAEVRERIRADHAAGRSLAGIARDLNDEGVPTAHGGVQWYPATVRAVIRAAA